MGSVLVEAVYIFLKYIQNTLLRNLAAQTVYPWNLAVLDCLPCKTWLPWTAYSAESGCPGPPTLQTVYPTEPGFHRTMVYMRLRVACLDWIPGSISLTSCLGIELIMIICSIGELFFCFKVISLRLIFKHAAIDKCRFFWGVNLLLKFMENVITNC